MENTLASIDATLNDVVQINLYFRDIKDFRLAADVFNISKMDRRPQE